MAKGIDKISVGLGMVPRGEMGLILASIGLTLTVTGERIIDANIYSGEVVMVILTTLMTPPALKWSLERSAK